MPPIRPLAAVVALGAAAYVLAGCTAGAEPAGRHSLRATIVFQTPTMHSAPATSVPDPETTAPRPSPVRVNACHPSKRAIPVRAPSGTTTRRVTRAWGRIETWLDRHAPKSARTLRNPASDADIARMQARLGHALPPDLVASLRRHDGADEANAAFTFPPFHVPMSTERIAAEWRTMCSVIEDLGTENPGDWDPRFTPFALANDGGELYDDQNGQVGEYFAEVGPDTKGYPASFAAFLETTATLLETGRPGPSRFRAHTHDGVLDWKP